MTVSSANIDWNAASAHAVIATLKANGVSRAVISPGSRSTPLVLAAAEHIETTVVLDERVAGFHALGLARRYGGCALICTSGTAGAHYYPAVIEASLSRTPLFILTADRPPELQDCGAPQTVRQAGMFGSHVRYAVTLPTPSGSAQVDSAVKLTSRALVEAFGSPKGPVHLNAPFRKPLWNMAPETYAPVSIPVVSPPTRQGGGLDEITDAFRNASQPIIYVGPHAPAGALRAARDCGQGLAIPVLTELSPPDHNIAHLDLLLRSHGLRSTLSPDLIVQVGHGPIGRGVLDWMASYEGMHICLDPDGWQHSATHSATHVWAGDVVSALGTLATSRPCLSREWLTAWTQASAVAAAALEGLPDTFDERVIATLTSALRSHLHVASSMPIRDVAAFGRPVCPTYSRGTNGIDGTIATALGLGSTTALLGDLALRHDISGLMTASELGASIDVVCADNSGGGIFHLLPIAQHAEVFERYFATPQRVDLSRMASAAGAEVVVVESPAALRTTLQSEPNGIRVVIANVDRQASVASRKAATDHVVSAVDREVMR